MGARWRVGDGVVAALAFPADAEVVSILARGVAAQVRDPRFTVKWTGESTLHLSVDAIDHGVFLNDQAMWAQVSGANKQKVLLEQTAPGRYEVSIGRDRSSEIVTIRLGDRMIERFAVAGRYAAEFERIGNDRGKLKLLADRSGGRVIEPGQREPIKFHRAARKISLDLWAGLGGALGLAVGAILWKRG
jgi:hypothetical protein